MNHIKSTNANRSVAWEEKLNTNNQYATLMVGVGASKENLGKISILTPYTINKHQVVALLEGLIAGIKTGHIKINQ